MEKMFFNLFLANSRLCVDLIDFINQIKSRIKALMTGLTNICKLLYRYEARNINILQRFIKKNINKKIGNNMINKNLVIKKIENKMDNGFVYGLINAIEKICIEKNFGCDFGFSALIDDYGFNTKSYDLLIYQRTSLKKEFKKLSVDGEPVRMLNVNINQLNENALNVDVEAELETEDRVATGFEIKFKNLIGNYVVSLNKKSLISAEGKKSMVINDFVELFAESINELC